MNTPTPTPRTDGLPQPSHFTSGDLAAWVDAAHKRIRQLERELSEAQRELDAWRECGLLQDVKAKEDQINSLRLQFCQSQGIALTNDQIDAHMLRCVENQKIEQPYYP